MQHQFCMALFNSAYLSRLCLSVSGFYLLAKSIFLFASTFACIFCLVDFLRVLVKKNYNCSGSNCIFIRICCISFIRARSPFLFRSFYAYSFILPLFHPLFLSLFRIIWNFFPLSLLYALWNVICYIAYVHTVSKTENAFGYYARNVEKPTHREYILGNCKAKNNE